MSFRARLTAAFLLVVIVPLLVGAALVATALPRAIAQRQERAVVASSRLAGLVVAELCTRAQAAAESAALAAATPDPARLAAVLQQLVDRRLVDGVRVVAPGAVTVATAGTAPAVSNGKTAKDCSDGVIVSDGSQRYIAARLALQRPAAPGSGPLPSPGTVIAAIAADGALARRLSATIGSGEVLLLAGGQVVAQSDAVDQDLVAAALVAGSRPVQRRGQIAAVSETRPGQAVAVLLAMPVGEGVRVLPAALGIAGLATLLAAGIAVMLARATTRPIEELSDAAARIASGDLTTTISVRNRDEVGRLAEAFNSMREELRGYIGALQKSRDEVQATVARLGDALSGTHDLDRILGVVLETAQASTGARAGAVLLVSGDHLNLAAGQGLAEHAVPDDLRLTLGEGIAGRVARTGVPVRGRSGEGLSPADGEPRGVNLVALPLKSSQTVVGVLVLFDRDEPFDEGDLTTLRAFASQATVAVDNVLLHEEARRQSITDGLTGLWNYRYFQLTVAKEIDRAARFGRPLSLLILDLDLFKRVNDRYGHQRGDDALVELAERLRGQVRDVDLLARYGGEEFVAVLPETDEDGAVQAAERIRNAVRRGAFGRPGQEQLELTVSIGVAVFPEHGDTSGVLLRRADEALYAAKRAGRDTYRVASGASTEPRQAREDVDDDDLDDQAPADRAREDPARDEAHEAEPVEPVASPDRPQAPTPKPTPETGRAPRAPLDGPAAASPRPVADAPASSVRLPDSRAPESSDTADDGTAVPPH